VGRSARAVLSHRWIAEWVPLAACPPVPAMHGQASCPCHPARMEPTRLGPRRTARIKDKSTGKPVTPGDPHRRSHQYGKHAQRDGARERRGNRPRTKQRAAVGTIAAMPLRRELSRHASGGAGPQGPKGRARASQRHPASLWHHPRGEGKLPVARGVSGIPLTSLYGWGSFRRQFRRWHRTGLARKKTS
jgi:hypothetical protein